MLIEKLHSIYFVGIGGIGMSALARYLHAQGLQVAGYDRTCTDLTRALEKEGIAIHYTDEPALLPRHIDLVVYTPAVPKNHQELQQLRSTGVPIVKRAELLGLISRSKHTLAVAGTHGKTTTSTLLAWLLAQAEMQPTAFLGGIALNWNSNYVAGKGPWVVVEADEFDRSFLHLHPNMAAIMSIDADHLDIYGDERQMWESGFLAFAKLVPSDGNLFVPERLRAVFAERQQTTKLITFGLNEGDYRAEKIRVEAGYFVFDFRLPSGELLEAMRLFLAGQHNVENAVAALAMALEAGMPLETAKEGLASFKGIKRRFERIVESEDVVYIDDYAHHPTELQAAIQAARMLYPDRKLTGIFQPHLYTRTRDFQRGFAKALDALDEAVLLEIYPAREEPLEGISSESIRQHMQNKQVPVLKKSEVPDYLRRHRPELLMTLGAGDIDTLVKPIAKLLTHRP